MSHQCALNKMGKKNTKKNKQKASKSVRMYLIQDCLCCPGQQRALEMGSVWKEGKVDEGLHDRIGLKFMQLELCLSCNAGLFCCIGS